MRIPRRCSTLQTSRDERGCGPPVPVTGPTQDATVNHPPARRRSRATESAPPATARRARPPSTGTDSGSRPPPSHHGGGFGFWQGRRFPFPGPLPFPSARPFPFRAYVVGAAQSGNRSGDAEPYADSDDPLTLNELCACVGGTSIEAANTTAMTQARYVERGDRDMEGIARVRKSDCSTR